MTVCKCINTSKCGRGKSDLVPHPPPNRSQLRKWLSAHMRVDLLDAVPRFIKEKMTRTGTHHIQGTGHPLLYHEDLVALH
eukprot:3117669-Amphidinium_carterae.1